MWRKVFAAMGVILFCSSVFADSGSRDFSGLDPTVKITSYRKLFIGDVQAVASGSGTLISDQGLILTNNHLIFDEDAQVPLDAFSVCLTFNIKEEPVCEYTAQLVANNQDMDVALLKLSLVDVFGQRIPFPLPFLKPQNDPAIHEQDRIQIVGYPASGGKTITITQGQVSGSEKFSGYRYFKTDTDFDHGSSGGTALNSEGQFVGMPTYLRSYAENVGYFLDLQEAASWISAHRDDKPPDNQKWDSFLRDQLKIIARTNQENLYSHPVYPYFELKLPKDWEAVSAYRDAVFFAKKNSQDVLTLNFKLSFYQFPIEKPYYDRLYEDLDKMKENYPDYSRTKVALGGRNADLVTYTNFLQRDFDYYLAFGYSMMHIHTAIDLNKAEIQQKEILSILDSLGFEQEILSEPKLDTEVVFDDPAFRISSNGDWRFQKHSGEQPEGLIAEAVEKDNFDGYIYLLYQRLSKGEQSLTAKDRLDQAVQNLHAGQATLVTKNDEVVLDGLTGWLVTYEYEGNVYQEMHQRLEVHLNHGEYELSLVYDDLADSFKRNIPVIGDILHSFRNDDPHKGITAKKRFYQFGELTYPFDDIQYHRFAIAITSLTGKGIFKNDGVHFFPEASVSRAQALTIILNSRRDLERMRGEKRKWSIPYYIARPKAAITLAETLKILMQVYEVPVWSNADALAPWYKPYMDKGFELGIIPYGLFDPGHKLTRGELAGIVDAIYNQAK